MPLPWTKISQTIVLCLNPWMQMYELGNPTVRVNMFQAKAKMCSWSITEYYSVEVLRPGFCQTIRCRLGWPGTMPAPLSPKMWMVYAGRTAAICCDYINMHRRGNQANTLSQLLPSSLFLRHPAFCPVVMTCYQGVVCFAVTLWSYFSG